MNIIRRKVMAFAFLVLPFGVVAQVLSTTDEVRIGTLENGMKYYIHPNAKPQKKVELRLVVSAGSMQEEEDQLGIAHFTEHMLFNGTKSFPKNMLVDTLQKMGIAFGADLNAYTSFDETVYMLPIPSENRAYIETGFKILREWAGEANMFPADIDAERGVVFEESRSSKGADQRMYKKYFPNLFAGTLYADRLPIGSDSIIKHAPYSAFERFYKTWYRPNLMALIVVGDISMDEGEALVKKYFSDFQNPATIVEKEVITVEKYEKSKAMVLSDKEATGYSFQLFFSNQAKSKPNTIQTYRQNIVNSLFASIVNSRFSDMREVADPPFANAGVGIYSNMKGYECFVVTATPTNNMNLTIETVITELNRVQKHGVTQDELDFQRKRLMSNLENAIKGKANITSEAIVYDYIANFLEGAPMPSLEQEQSYYNTIVPTITVAEINKAAQSWIDQSNTFFALITGPDTRKIKLPTDREVVAAIEQNLAKEVGEYNAKALKQQLITEELVAGKIVSESTDTAFDATTFVLDNGIQVTYKKTALKDDQIRMMAIKKGGTNAYSEGVTKPNAMFASLVLDQVGYGGFTPNDMRKFLSDKKANVGLGMSETHNTLSGSSNEQDFETLMQLIHLKLTSLNYDTTLFNGFINTYKTQLSFLGLDPTYAFLDTLNKVYYKNDAKAPIVLPTPEMFETLDLNVITDIYNKEFKNTDGLHFYFVGSLNPDTVKQFAQLYLGSLKNNNTQPKFIDNGLRAIQGFNELEIAKGADDKSLIVQIYHGELDYNEDLALKASILSEILNIKIIEDIRENLAAIYSGGTGIEFEKDPYSYYKLTLQLPCGPESVDTVLYTLQSELNKLKKEGISEVDLNKVKTNLVTKYKENIQNNEFWMNRLANVYSMEGDKDFYLNYLQILDKISPNDIKATANIIFGGPTSNVFQAVLKPAPKD